ncbi:hypothetical protein GN244_ATG12898 [Phytophthora infestans]|uniref:Uncharacterized protein n=1 Tax=Phytophthora infestans TaxID=4787 RepID=A0A833SZ08_PHYIN|nr:hypothetical protein GN244_ATG12898 [Phytophthora infestans]
MTAEVHLEATIAGDQLSGVFNRHEPETGDTANHRDEVVGANRHGAVTVARHHVVRNVDSGYNLMWGEPSPSRYNLTYEYGYRSAFSVDFSASGSDIPTGELEWNLSSGS